MSQSGLTPLLSGKGGGNIGALIRIGSWGPLYYNHNEEPQNSICNYYVVDIFAHAESIRTMVCWVLPRIMYMLPANLPAVGEFREVGFGKGWHRLGAITSEG